MPERLAPAEERAASGPHSGESCCKIVTA